MRLETLGKIGALSNGGIKSYGLFEPILKFDGPDILVTE
jgi:hypothetical protein